jgi:hypothetical protein
LRVWFSFQGIFFKDMSSAPTLKASFASPIKLAKTVEQVHTSSAHPCYENIFAEKNIAMLKCH